MRKQKVAKPLVRKGSMQQMPGLDIWKADSEAGAWLLREYTERKILIPGKGMQISAAEPLLFQLIKERNIKIAFEADLVMDIEELKHIDWAVTGTKELFRDFIGSDENSGYFD